MLSYVHAAIKLVQDEIANMNTTADCMSTFYFIAPPVTFPICICPFSTGLRKIQSKPSDMADSDPRVQWLLQQTREQGAFATYTAAATSLRKLAVASRQLHADAEADLDNQRQQVLCQLMILERVLMMCS